VESEKIGVSKIGRIDACVCLLWGVNVDDGYLAQRMPGGRYGPSSVFRECFFPYSRDCRITQKYKHTRIVWQSDHPRHLGARRECQGRGLGACSGGLLGALGLPSLGDSV
jgi:hypothetical protein